MSTTTNELVKALLRDNLELREELTKLNKELKDKESTITLFFNKWQDELNKNKQQDEQTI